MCGLVQLRFIIVKINAPKFQLPLLFHDLPSCADQWPRLQKLNCTVMTLMKCLRQERWHFHEILLEQIKRFSSRLAINSSTTRKGTLSASSCFILRSTQLSHIRRHANDILMGMSCTPGSCIRGYTMT